MVKMTLLYFGTVHALHRQLNQSSFQEGDPWQEYKSGQTDSDVIIAIDALVRRKVPMAVINGCLEDQAERTSGVSKTIVRIAVQRALMGHVGEAKGGQAFKTVVSHCEKRASSVEVEDGEVSDDSDIESYSPDDAHFSLGGRKTSTDQMEIEVIVTQSRLKFV